MRFPRFSKPDKKVRIILEEDTNLKRELGSWHDTFMKAIAVVMSLFHIYVLGFRPITPYHLYTAHVTFSMVLIFGLYAIAPKAKQSRIPWYDWILMILAVASGIYLASQMETLVYRIGVSPTVPDLVFSAILLILVLEITRRTTGNILPLIAVIFLLYARYGRYIPGILGHRGYGWNRIISYMAGLDAIFSVPVGASASFVFLFVLFSAFLHVSGAGKTFIDLAVGLTGRTRGGPAKAAVVASAMFGTVSGNSVANVVSTGSFTIPLMKSIGYAPRFAGAVEAVASTGGQIMPPIMGSAAFILAQLIGVSYLRVVQAAIIPALLYYLAVFIMVDLEAAKTGLKGLDSSRIPSVRAVLKSSGYLLLPLAVLIFVLVILKATPMRAALWGIMAAFVVSFVKKETWMTPKRLVEALNKGARDALSMVSACATAGIVIGVLNLTGTGLKFASAIVSLAGGNLPVALVLTMLASIILGMGLPTTAAYLITAAVVAPALVQMGLSPLAAHMFVFFFACISAITPPVALAAYAGANLAKAKPTEVGITATMLGITAFIVPYMFAYGEELLWTGTAGQIIRVMITSVIGVISLSIGLQGWLFNRNMTIIPRILLIIAALNLIDPGVTTDLIGILTIVIAIILEKFNQKRSDNTLSSIPSRQDH